MSSIIKIPQETDPTYAAKDKPRKPYDKPQLIDLGDLRTLTLGSSVGSSPDSSPGIGTEWTYP